MKASAKGTKPKYHKGDKKKWKAQNPKRQKEKEMVGLPPKKKDDSPSQQHSYKERLEKEKGEKKD